MIGSAPGWHHADVSPARPVGRHRKWLIAHGQQALVEYDRLVTVTAPRAEDGPPVPLDPPVAIEVLRVSAGGDVKAIAGAIAGCVRRSGSVVLEVIGAGALNQAIKAAVVARAITIREGLDLVVTPSFHGVEIDGDERTALRLLVEHRHR